MIYLILIVGPGLWKSIFRYLFIGSYKTDKSDKSDKSDEELTTVTSVSSHSSSVAHSSSSSPTAFSSLTRAAHRIDALLGSVRGLRLVACFLALQICYLSWGVLQEKVMTTP